MANFGIGLGGFVDGFSKGYGIRSDMDDRKDRKARQQRDDAYQDEVRARQKELWGRDDKQYARDETQRDNIERIGKDAKTVFDASVEMGTAKPDEFDNFWTNYALPRMKNELLLQGNLSGAEKLQEWGDSAAAKQGAKLFSGALLKAQTGDYEGALDGFLKAGQTKGYMDHGMTLVSKDRLISPDKTLLGFRLKLKSADGKEVVQDVPLDKVIELGATFANPEAAWKSQTEARARAAKKADELGTYAAKKEIDSAYGVKSKDGREKAIAELRKRLDGGLAGDEPTFDDMTAEEKEKLIADELALQSGETAPGLGAKVKQPQRKVIADTVTGRVMRPDEAATDATSRKAADTMQKIDSSPEMKAKRVASREVELKIQMAEHRLKNLGDKPQTVAADLEASGVPKELWPEELLKALGVGQK